MIIVLLHVAVSVVRTRIHVLEVLRDFLDDTITKTEVAPFKQPPPPHPPTHTPPHATSTTDDDVCLLNTPPPLAHRRS